MIYYSLFNKRLKVKLTHPKIGVWNTPDLQEARDMLQACRDYVKSFEMPGYESDFVIIDAETEETIEC